MKADLKDSTAPLRPLSTAEVRLARFRTMAISRAAVLTGHVAGSMIQTLISAALVIGVALLVGFRPTASPVAWIGAIGVLAMLALALTWLSAGIGLWARPWRRPATS